MLSNTAYGLTIDLLDIVVVEDNESMIRILRTLLSAFGVTNIRSHTTCKSALADILNQPPNLVITDWRMAPVNGLRFLKSLRHVAMGDLARTAVVMVSGHASTARVKQAMLAGANQFLVKPVSPAALLARLEFVVRDARKFVLQGDQYVIEGVDLLLADQRPQPSAPPPPMSRGSSGESEMTLRQWPGQDAGDETEPAARDAGHVWEL
ncbi:MAG: PleD family two-component system response regulator [Hyphomicrobiales bacterium]